MSDRAIDTPRNTPPAPEAHFRRRVVTATLIVLALVLVVQFVTTTSQLLLLLFVSLLFAIVIRTAVNWLSAHTPLSDKVGFAVVVIGSLVLMIGLGWFIGPRLVEQGNRLVDQLPEAVNSFETWIRSYTWGDDLLNNLPQVNSVSGILTRGDTGLVSRVTGTVSFLAEAVGVVLILVFTALYLSIEPGIYVRNFVRLFPKKLRSRIRHVLDTCYHALQGWLLTRIVSMVVNSVLTFIGLSVLGVPFALTLSVLEAFLSFVPTFGPLISAVPAILVGALDSPTTALYVAGLYLAVEMVDNYGVTPLLQRFMLYLPPGVVLATQVLLTALVGRIGLVVAAPLVVATIPIVRMLYVRDVLHDEGDDDDG